MEFDDTVEGCDALHGIHIEDARLGDEEGAAGLGNSGIQLRVLVVVEGQAAAKRILVVWVESCLLGLVSCLGCLLDHGNDIIVDELSRAQPTAQGPDLALLEAEAVDGVLEGLITLQELLLESDEGIGFLRRQVSWHSPEHGVALDSLRSAILNALSHELGLVPDLRDFCRHLACRHLACFLAVLVGTISRCVVVRRRALQLVCSTLVVVVVDGGVVVASR
mmetsp:Transcript_1744/g.4823  ORF Transcript_1744/g.4823 Transcript_1744/m.4823 type:complete len:221 (-) Transcript_1744:41-703(-)